MKWSDLPSDLVEEILSRVPATSLRKLLSTSKQWNTLVKTDNFAKKHSANAPKKSLIIMLMDSRVYIVTVNLNGFHNNVASSRKYQLPLKDPLMISSQVGIRRIFHCDGLLLCTTTDTRLVVWNMCLGETKWIRPRDRYKEFDIYALGYDHDHKSSYKILRMDGYEFDTYPYEIYDFTSDSWRILGVANGWRLPIRNAGGISLKGDTYWLAIDISQGQAPDFLLCFDFSKESFQNLPLNHQFSCELSALSVVGEEKLCLFDDINSNVWMGTKTGSVISWNKFLSIKASFNIYIGGLCFLVDEQNKLVLCCEKHYSTRKKILHIVGEKKHIKLDHGKGSTGISTSSALLNYVPSLARIGTRYT